MPLVKAQVKALKKWVDDLDSGAKEHDPITLKLTKDGKDYITDITVSGTKWTSRDLYISPGFIITTNSDTGAYKVLETGHDYALAEAETDYHWEFDSDTYHPMVIDGILKVLKKVDSEPSTGIKYQINNNWYVPVDSTEAAILTATNTRRSNLNLTKTVVDAQGKTVSDSTDKFIFTGSITDKNGSDVWFSIEDASGNIQMDSSLVSGATAEIKDEKATGYYYVASGGNITVKLQSGWNLRVTNIPKGSTYSFTENDSLPAGYEFRSVDSTTTTKKVNGQTISGTIDEANKSYTVTYTNTRYTADITLKKVSTEGNTPLAGAKFSLTKQKSDGTTWEEVKTDYTNFEVNSDGITFNGLKPGIYKLTENSAPDGYIIQQADTIFVVSAGSNVNKNLNFQENVSYQFASIKGNVLTIENTPGKSLPETGGYGTLPYTVGGFLMTSAAIFI